MSLSSLNPIVDRWEEMTALWVKCQGDYTELNPNDVYNFRMAIRESINFFSQLSTLKNLSLIAHMTDDTQEQHKICAAIDELMTTGMTSYFKNLEDDLRDHKR